MPSGITGRDGYLPALVKSIRRSFPCRHPTTGGSLKGSPAGTPLTHRFLYYPYSTTAAAVCQPSFCPGPQPAGRRDGPSGEFASVFWYREKSPFGQQKSPIYSGFSQETSFLSPHYGVPEVIRTPDLLLRRQSLYPAELRKHFNFLILFYIFPNFPTIII